MITTIVNIGSNEFIADGHEVDAQYIRVTVPRNPDPTREKYSGDPLNPIAAKSAGEITAAADAAKDVELTAVFDNVKALKAVAVAALWGRLGHQPTAPEIAAERARILAIYKAL